MDHLKTLKCALPTLQSGQIWMPLLHLPNPREGSIPPCCPLRVPNLRVWQIKPWDLIFAYLLCVDTSMRSKCGIDILLWQNGRQKAHLPFIMICCWVCWVSQFNSLFTIQSNWNCFLVSTTSSFLEHSSLPDCRGWLNWTSLLTKHFNVSGFIENGYIHCYISTRGHLDMSSNAEAFPGGRHVFRWHGQASREMRHCIHHQETYWKGGFINLFRTVTVRSQCWCVRIGMGSLIYARNMNCLWDTFQPGDHSDLCVLWPHVVNRHPNATLIPSWNNTSSSDL